MTSRSVFKKGKSKDQAAQLNRVKTIIIDIQERILKKEIEKGSHEQSNIEERHWFSRKLLSYSLQKDDVSFKTPKKSPSSWEEASSQKHEYKDRRTPESETSLEKGPAINNNNGDGG